MDQALFDERALAGDARPRLRLQERRQVALRAVSLDRLVAADHRLRLAWGLVAGLELAPLYAGIRAVEGRPEHPPADPRILVALWCTRRWRDRRTGQTYDQVLSLEPARAWPWPPTAATPAMAPTWRQADGIGGIRWRAIRSTAPELESAG